MTLPTPADSFSQSYVEASAKFRVTAAGAGAALTRYANPNRGPNGEALATDVARFGPADAAGVLLINSGTHGAEGFCGSGAQIALMAAGWQRRLPPGVALVLSHAINPYGFAWLRRVTEENVDLNRNFVDHAQPHPANPGYAEIHDWLLPAAWEGPERETADAALARFTAERGDLASRTAQSSGQYTHPDGMFYGGIAPTWSNRTFHAIIDAHLRTAQRFCFFDLHTGLGPSGYGEPSYVGRDTEEGFAEAQRWFGPDVTWLSRGTGASQPLGGHIGEPFAPYHARGVTGPVLGIEFGTHPREVVRTALRAEHWLHRRGIADGQLAARIKRDLRDAFYVDADEWKAQIVARCEELTGKAIANLAQA
ncbi:MAG: M14 family metallopeptidase [Alphaproteobacteria bacterium]|nr:M14 family metallopeptidase [Alphaproteobacteria bacterium]